MEKNNNRTISSNILKIAGMEEKAKKERTRGEKLAEHVASFCGSTSFVYIHIFWFGGWIVINTMTLYVFDKFPLHFSRWSFLWKRYFFPLLS